MRRCVPHVEILDVLNHCHNLDYGGPNSSMKTVKKIWKSRFYWPTMYQDAKNFVVTCDPCQRTGNISRQNEMPLQ